MFQQNLMEDDPVLSKLGILLIDDDWKKNL